ncbi:MAG: HlyD family type I secretion periplasmic adaptor subunit [Gammaproteobacteria bacterium]
MADKPGAGQRFPRLRRAARAVMRMVVALSERSGNASSILLLSIALLMVAAVTWASIAQLDEVTRGEGKVIPSQQLQVVQSLEGGIVRNILVHEGDSVRAGTPLMELDPTIHRSQYEQALRQYYTQAAQAYRLEAESADKKLEMPKELTEKASVQVMAETSLYIGRQNELRTQLGGLREQLAQKQQELAASAATLTGTERALELSRQSRDVIKRLVSKGLEAELSLIGEEAKVNDLENKLAVTRTEGVRLLSAIQEVREKVDTTAVSFRSAALGELAQTRGKVSELQAQLDGLKDRVERTMLVAPVSGIVNRLTIKTIGAVAQPAETLVELVPMDDSLIVEAYVKPSDIAFVYAGQNARVKVTAYDASRYGGLEGQIIKVSADAVRNPEAQGRPEMQGGSTDVYVVTVKTGAAQLRKNGKPLTILPGMKAEVDIITGKRTVLDYLVHPVTKIADRAFRETPH